MSKKSPVMSLEGPKYPTLEKLRGTSSQGSTALAIRNAAAVAEQFIDLRTNALKDDAVFVPMGDRVTVRRISEAELSAGGVTIPDAGKTPAAYGVVVGVGQGRYNIMGVLIPVRVQIGAVVMFGKYAGTEVPMFGIGKKDLPLSLREEEIMGVIMSKAQAEEIFATSDPQITPVDSGRVS